MPELQKVAYLEDERIKIARGQVKNLIPVHKVADVPQVSISVTGTIWDKNDTLYPWSVWDSGAQVLSVGSSSASDVGKKVVLVGLDENYDVQTEEVTLTTQTGNLSTKQFLRIHLAYVSFGGTNVGTISVKVDTTDVMLITIGNATSLASIYTIPNGYTGYLFKGVCTCQASADGTGKMFIRPSGNGGIFRVAHSFEVSGGSEYDYEFSFPPEIPEKSDIDVRITNRTNNARYTAAYDLLLVKNPNTN